MLEVLVDYFILHSWFSIMYLRVFPSLYLLACSSLTRHFNSLYPKDSLMQSLKFGSGLDSVPEGRSTLKYGRRCKDVKIEGPTGTGDIEALVRLHVLLSVMRVFDRINSMSGWIILLQDNIYIGIPRLPVLVCDAEVSSIPMNLERARGWRCVLTIYSLAIL